MSDHDEERNRELQDIHNQGEKDGSNNDYSPPPNVGLGDIFLPESFVNDKVEDREAYDKGYENGRKQR